MTRRRIVFLDKTTNKIYITNEFNGDKDEFIQFRCGDTCNMNWQDIMNKYFSNIQTLDDFKLANEKAQKEYISSITGKSEILPIEETNDINYYKQLYGNNLYFV